jgi:hypothetical protein
VIDAEVVVHRRPAHDPADVGVRVPRRTLVEICYGGRVDLGCGGADRGADAGLRSAVEVESPRLRRLVRSDLAETRVDLDDLTSYPHSLGVPTGREYPHRGAAGAQYPDGDAGGLSAAPTDRGGIGLQGVFQVGMPGGPRISSPYSAATAAI